MKEKFISYNMVQLVCDNISALKVMVDFVAMGKPKIAGKFSF